MPEYYVQGSLAFIVEAENEEEAAIGFEEMAFDFFRDGNTVNREDLVIMEEK